MLKKIIFTSLLIFSVQNVMAVNLDDVNSAANNLNEATDTAQQASDTAEQINKDSVSDMTKQVASDSAKGGAEGAVEGAASGSVVEGGTKGTVLHVPLPFILYSNCH